MKNILIVQTAFLGDLLMSSPLIKAVKKAFPDSKIDILVKDGLQSVPEEDSNINRIITLSKNKGLIHRLFGFFSVLSLLRRNNYYYAFSMQISMTSSLLLYLASIPVRVGARRQKLLSHKVVFPRKGMHIRHRALELIKRIRKDDYDDKTYIVLSDSDRKKADLLFPSDHKYKYYIAVSPGSVRATKMWPLKYYAELLSMFDDTFFFLTGTTEEKGLCERILKESNAQGIITAGSLSIRETAALIKKCDMVLCNDSAPLHMANCVKTPVAAFFGPTVKGFGCYPYRKYDILFETNDLICRPCGKHGGKKCPEEHFRCMNDIIPADVFPVIMNRIRELYA